MIGVGSLNLNVPSEECGRSAQTQVRLYGCSYFILASEKQLRSGSDVSVQLVGNECSM